jgi:hypothetical protein
MAPVVVGAKEKVAPLATVTGVPVAAVWTPVTVRLSRNHPTLLAGSAVKAEPLRSIV